MTAPSLFEDTETEPVKPHTVTAYTDGSCLSNPGGRSGASAILFTKNGSRVLRQGFWKSSNQRSELLGLLMALEACAPETRLLVRSDSLYAVDGFRTHQHAPDFRLPMANRDLWVRIRTAARLLESVETAWVKGHNGDPGNEEADHHAGEAAQFGPWIHDTDEIPKSPVAISPGSSYISPEQGAAVASKGIQ